MFFSGGSGSVVFGIVEGTYTRTGDMVTAFVDISTTDIGLLSGNVSINNLPFTSKADSMSTAAHVGLAGGMAITAGQNVSGRVNAGGRRG